MTDTAGTKPPKIPEFLYAALFACLRFCARQEAGEGNEIARVEQGRAESKFHSVGQHRLV